MNVYTQGNASAGFTTYIAVTAGETLALAMNLSVNGDAINLAGYSLKCQINFHTPLLLTTENSGITITDSDDGAIQLNISSTESAEFIPGVYRYDLWMKSDGDVETPLLAGQFSVTPSISPVP